MWSDNPPAAVSALRDMIVACASAVTAELVQDNFHYPSAAMGSDDTTTTDPLPLCVIGEESSVRTPYCEPGVIGLPSGTLLATIFSTEKTGVVETLADDICRELNLSVTGLPNVSASRVRAKEPAKGERAASEDTGKDHAPLTAIDISVSYGLKG